MTNLKRHQYGIAYGLANKPELLVCEFRSACNWTGWVKLVRHVFSSSGTSGDRRPALSNEKAQTTAGIFCLDHESVAGTERSRCCHESETRLGISQSHRNYWCHVGSRDD